MGHMNVMWYAGKFDEASWHFLSNLGVTRSYLSQQNSGMAALQQNLSYKKELYAGDIITIRSRLIEMREKTIRFVHEMWNDATGEIAAISELTGIYLDAATRKSRPIPKEIRERALELLNDQNLCYSDEGSFMRSESSPSFMADNQLAESCLPSDFRS
jgi:acyl-CoA thioester hydrolase